jgi:transcriptional regulator with XRE-family HTH domain
MDGLRARRKLSGFSQIALSRGAGVSRMRLQMAEAGELRLRPEEIDAVSRVLRDALERRAAMLRNALGNSSA